MAKSKNRPKYKAKKKKANIYKQKLKEMANEAKNQPITFVYHKDKETVEVPIKMWQVLNQSAQQLQSIAMFVTTMETIGQQHMQDGTLLPVFNDDIEPSGQRNPDGSPQMKIKDSFWIRGPLPKEPTVEKPVIVEADGKTIYKAEGKYEEEKATLEFPTPTIESVA